jgi:hypothetical protein
MIARHLILNKHSIVSCLAALMVAFSAVALAQDAKPEKVKLLPNVEKEFNAFIEKAKETRKGITKADLTKLCDEVATSVKLTAEQRARLETEAQPAIAETCDKFGSKLDEWLRPFIAGYGDRAMANLERWDANQFASKPNVAASPQDSKAWEVALNRVLTPEQREVYQSEMGDKPARRRKEIGIYLKDALAARRIQLVDAFKLEREGLVRELALDKERTVKLESAEKTAVDAILAEDEAAAVKQFSDLPDDMWRQMFSSGGTHQFDNVGGNKGPLTKREGWTQAIGTVLTADELQRWEKSLARRQERRDLAAKMGAVTELEERVLLSPEQRPKLEKVFLEAWRRQAPNENTQIFPYNLLRGGTSDPEVRAVLTKEQLKRWDEFLRGSTARGLAAVVRQEKSSAVTQPVDTEQLFATHLVKLYHGQRDRMTAVMQDRVDEIVRVTSLAGPPLKLVEVAAKGAVERVLDTSWKSSMDRNVRNSVQGVGPQFLKQRLDAMGESRYSVDPPEKHPVWSQALRAALTEEQLKAYDNVQAERMAYRERAIVNMVLAQLDSTLRLSGEQGDKLEPLLAASVKEYWQDYERNFSGSSYAIYPYYLPVLLSGIPKDDREAILTQEQVKQYDSEGNTRYSGWWESMKRNHDQRKKAAK